MPDEGLPARRCGPCTFCCKVMEVAELEKPAGAACVNCRAGAGCAIYEGRPASCRDFVCGWLVNPNLPHRLRPDQCKVVLNVDTAGRRMIACCDVANPHAWRREPMYGLLKRMAANAQDDDRQVIAMAGRQVWIITPSQDVALGDVDPGSSYIVEEAPGGAVRVTVVPPAPA